MITIVGAGLGGLTLASVLHRNGITAVVYDADLSATSRPQGGMLDIHQDTGQAALRAAGLLEAFGKLTLEHGDAMRILDKTGTLRMAHDGNGLATGNRPRRVAQPAAFLFATGPRSLECAGDRNKQ